MTITFEGMDRRIGVINEQLPKYGIVDLQDAFNICKQYNIDVNEKIKAIQPIAFENAVWAYTVGTAIAIKKQAKTASQAAKCIGLGLQMFCIPGSVADQRQVGVGHGNLASMLLEDTTQCFAFVAGHESFAAAEGAIGLCKTANKARKPPLRVEAEGSAATQRRGAHPVPPGAGGSIFGGRAVRRVSAVQRQGDRPLPAQTPGEAVAFAERGPAGAISADRSAV